MSEEIQGTEMENYFVIGSEENRMEIEHAGKTSVLIYRNPTTQEVVDYENGKFKISKRGVPTSKNDLSRRVKFALQILTGCEKYAIKGEDGKICPITVQTVNWKDKIPLQHLDALCVTVFDGVSASEVESD